MSSTKKKKSIRAIGNDDSDESDHFEDFEDGLKCSKPNRFRKPIILKPGIMEQEVRGNEVIQRWGLPTPCECKGRDNTADVIVSAIEFWKPSALSKLLDLSVSQFHCSISTENMDFYVKRSWNFVRAALDKWALSYHIYDDGKWQLLGFERWGIEEICTMDHCKENWHDCHIQKGDRKLAARLVSYFPWRQESFEEFEFECYITTKDGQWIDIDKSDSTGGNATLANKNSAPQQVSLQPDTDTEIETATTNATSTMKTDRSHLQETKKRKRAAE